MKKLNKILIIIGIILLIISIIWIIVKKMTLEEALELSLFVIFPYLIISMICVAVVKNNENPKKNNEKPDEQKNLYEILMVSGDKRPFIVSNKPYVLKTTFMKRYDEQIFPNSQSILKEFFPIIKTNTKQTIQKEPELEQPDLATRLARKYYIENGISTKDGKKTNFGDIVEMNEFLPGEKIDTVDMFWLDDDIQRKKKKNDKNHR